MKKGTPNPATKGTVLIFDDEPNMGRIMVKMLGLEGYQAQAYTNPIEGLEAVDKIMPDVLITDLRMPEMDGMQVLNRIREQHPEIPVIILTAFGTLENVAEAIRAGAHEFVSKPFQSDRLLATVSDAVEHHSKLVQEGVGKKRRRKLPAFRINKKLTVFIDPGEADADDITELFMALSDVYRSVGGQGLKVESEDFLVHIHEEAIV